MHMQVGAISRSIKGVPVAAPVHEHVPKIHDKAIFYRRRINPLIPGILNLCRENDVGTAILISHYCYRHDKSRGKGELINNKELKDRSMK